ncbi:MAG: hypothetical protein ABIP55_11570, partial [Tepidisphaeraceae bacterium]
MNATSLSENLAAINQHQVLGFLGQLDDAGKARLLQQLAALDLGEIDELAEKHVRRKSAMALPTQIEPVTTYPRRPGPDQQQLYADAAARGIELLKQGKIAAFLVAG